MLSALMVGNYNDFPNTACCHIYYYYNDKCDFSYTSMSVMKFVQEETDGGSIL